jgi:uncharacterized membrane protein YccF (DUF307 family)
VAEPTVTVADKRGGPNLLIRALWFVFVGWWLSFSVISLAGLATITVIGIPLGLWLANRIPQVATLKLDRTRFIATAHADGAATISISGVPQRPFWQRALWFALVGWWLTYLWLYLAWALCITIILMPVAFPMFSAAGKLLTLKRG